MRVSGPALSAALIDGIRDQGADVVDLGLVSTDALYFAVGKFGFPAGVMITASHNPARVQRVQNLPGGCARAFVRGRIWQIRDLVIANHFSEPASAGAAISSERDILDAYADHVLVA